jgi:hypothetical protein
MPTARRKKPWDLSVAEALSDALVGYLTLQARARMYQVYSEYLLYDIIARVAHGRHWHVECEVPLTARKRNARGDHQRIDFVLKKNRASRSSVLIEVKYCRSPGERGLSVKRDLEKLQRELRARGRSSTALLLVVGARRRDRDDGAPFPVKGLPYSLAQDWIYDVTFPARHTCFGATVWRIPKGAA